MKIIKSSTYRGLMADKHNLAKMIVESARQNTVISNLQTLANDQDKKIAKLETVVNYWQNLAMKHIRTIKKLKGEVSECDTPAEA